MKRARRHRADRPTYAALGGPSCLGNRRAILNRHPFRRRAHRGCVVIRSQRLQACGPAAREPARAETGAGAVLPEQGSRDVTHLVGCHGRLGNRRAILNRHPFRRRAGVTVWGSRPVRCASRPCGRRVVVVRISTGDAGSARAAVTSAAAAFRSRAAAGRCGGSPPRRGAAPRRSCAPSSCRAPARADAWRRRAEHEPRVALGDEVDRRPRDGSKMATSPAVNARRRAQRAVVDGDPRDVVSLRRLVASSARPPSGSPRGTSSAAPRSGSSRRRTRRGSRAPGPSTGPRRASRSGWRSARSRARAAARPRAGTRARAPGPARPVCHTPLPARIHSMPPAGSTPDLPVVSAILDRSVEHDGHRGDARVRMPAAAPSASARRARRSTKWSRNTNGLISSPRSDGLPGG